ncbi:MAG TPA: hypothetical protein DCQ92_13545 [Verrucomicrobia subdivision 3 bacterium]|nr:hypothetical protein [Limisphaerales bacterium]
MSRFKTSLGSLLDDGVAGELSPPPEPVVSVELVPLGNSPAPAISHFPFSCRIKSPTFISTFCFLSADSSLTRLCEISVTV